MPLFPFRVNICKLQEQDVMKKFTACTFPPGYYCIRRMKCSAHTHRDTRTHGIDRGTRDWPRCSPKHVRSLVWKNKKRNESISQPAAQGRQTLLSSAPTAGAPRFTPEDSWEITIQPLMEMKHFTYVLHLPWRPRLYHPTFIPGH